MYRNLKAEMARLDVTGKAIAEDIGITAQAFSDKMTGRTDFKLKEIRQIRDGFFKGMTLEYLFERNCEKVG